MSVVSTLIARSLPLFPKSLVGFFARPYIAGETLEDGVRVVKNLNARGIMATMDVLGESVTSKDESFQMRAKCEEVLRTIEARGLDANLSVKPTQLGLELDSAFCEDNIRHLCRIAVGFGNFIRIDMEDRTTTEATLGMYRRLRSEFPGHVGVVIQAYMRRSEADILNLLDSGETNIRLCKGIYVEPASAAFKERDEIRDNFRLLNRKLLERGAYVGIATHDDRLLEHGVQLVKELQLDNSRYEFQMLLGVRPQRRDQIVAAGHRMRVYVPFGDRWYAYSTRRLKENPQMAMHVLKAIFGFNK